MTRSSVWLLRCIALVASAGLVLVVAEAGAAMRAGSWLVVPDLAALELTVTAALGVAAIPILARGRRALQLEAWTRLPGWRGWLERLALLWCASLAAVLGALPGLALGLGPPAVWPLALLVLTTVAVRTLGSEPPKRVAWLLCTSYGLVAISSLVLVRHVF
jgi:hypothetical protein